MSGCCDHCLPNCQEIALTGDHEGPDCIAWRGGFCPACAERERIVAWLRGRRHPYDHAMADTIERGAHLEDQ